jgi:integrase/recombinase XerD
MKKIRVGVSDEEFTAMCATLNPYELGDLQKLTILHILHDTGMRVGELCDLNVSDISTPESYVCVETKKNKQLRWLSWKKEFHQNTLLRWLGSRICLNKHPSLFVSIDKHGRERITQRTVQRWVKEIAKKAGITNRIHPHMFRHAKAHKMKAQGADLKDIQMMLGHVSPFSALMYLNFDKNEMLANAEKYL